MPAVAGLKTGLDFKTTDYENEGGRDSDLIRFHKQFIGNLMKGDDKVKGESARETNLFSQREKKRKKNDAWLNEIMKSSSVTSTAPPSGNWLDDFTPELWITAKLIKWTGCLFFFRLLFVCFWHKQHHSYIIKLKTRTKSITTFHHLNAS